MSLFIKPLAVFLITILVFAGFAFLLEKDFLDQIQTHFYNPSKINSYVNENTKDAEITKNYLLELNSKFEQTLHEPAIRNSFLYNQTAEDIYQRSRIYGILMESVNGLQSVQFIDANGIRIHFSTSSRDIISQTASSASYRNYTEDTSSLPFETVSVPANGMPKFTMDDSQDRIVFSYPFYDSMDVYHGTALFSVSIRSIKDKLISEGRIKINENISMIGHPPGILLGSPDTFKTELQEKVSEVWNIDARDRIIIDSDESGIKFSLISVKIDSEGWILFFGRLVNDSIFNISDSLKNILYFSMFITFFLVLFFITNFKPSPITVVRNRIQRLKETLFEQLYEDKSTREKIRWLLELEQRRDEIKSELKYNLKISEKTKKVIDGIIDKSWDEIIAIITASSGHAALALKLSSIDPKDIVRKTQDAEIAENIEEVEEIEEISDTEDVEEIEEISDTEDIEEIEEISDIEDVEEIEEISDIEDVEEIEEISDIEEVEEIEEIEEISDIEEETTDEVQTLFDYNDDFIEELGEGQITVEFGTSPKKKTPPVSHKGLLRRAEEFITEPTEIYHGKGLLRVAEEYIDDMEIYPTRGLLARAIQEIRKSKFNKKTSGDKKATGKGLLAVASEIEFSDKYKTQISDDLDRIDDEIDEIINMDIVSPFVTMFSSLENEN